MRDILQSIVTALAASPNNFNCIGFYGNDWYLAFSEVNSKINFGFVPCSGRGDVDINIERINLSWTISVRNDQNSIAEATDAATLKTIKAINEKFMALLKAYTNSAGQQVFDSFGEYEWQELWDDNKHNEPILGYFCSWQFTKIKDDVTC